MATGVVCEGDLVVCVPKKKFFSKNKWVRCHATLYETGQLTFVGSAFEKVLDVSPKSKVKVVEVKGNRHCLSIDGKLVIDCVNSKTRLHWQTHLALKATKKKPLPEPRKKIRSLESFLLWHEEYYRSPEIASIHRRRWFRAIDHVAREVLERRNVLFGYTSLELIRLQKKIATIEHDTKGDIKRKARRILRQVLQDAREKKKWNDLVCGYAETKGIAMTADKAPNNNHKKDIYRDSVFKERLQLLLRREKVLPTLTRTLEVVRRKERHAFVVADAMRGLWVARCVRALLNLPGGLAALLAMPRERGSLRRLLAAAMLCRIPLLTSLVLEILGALALLPGHQGVGVVMNVLTQIDRNAKWGEPVCSDFMMRPSAEALRWSNKRSSDPPSFSAVATLLYQTREHSCCPELGCGVITLFAALCRCQSSRSAAQWMQARIFLACRAALKCEVDSHPRLASSSLSSDDATTINDITPPTTVQKRIQERRKMLGRERRVSDDFESAAQQLEVMHPCPPLLALLIDAQRDESTKLFAMQLEHFLDGWDHRELDEADEIDELAVGAARRTGLLAERVRRSALLLGRHVHIDHALHSLGLDLEHAALTPFQVIDANVKAAVDSADDDGPTILFDVHATTAALGKLQSKATFTGTTTAALATENGDGPQLKDDPRYAKFFRMIKLHIPKMAVAAKMASEGLDPAVLDLDSSEPAPPSPEQQGKKLIPQPPPLPPRGGGVDAPEKEEALADEKDTEPGLGCVRVPNKRLRRVFWDVVDNSEGTWWESLDDDAEESFLDADALDDLESVFEQTRRGSVIQADNSSAARTLQKEKLATQQNEPLVVEGARALVAQALGEKRAFALNLLYGSIRMSNDEFANAVAELDPGGHVFVSNLPRLGTLYNLVQRSDELASIEQVAIDAGILIKTTNGSRRNPENQSQLDGLSDLMVSLLEKARRPRAKVRALWLVATAKDQASELVVQLRNYEAAARCVIESASLRKLMCVVLSITNFVNHATKRGRNSGVRLDALTKLASTRTTGGSYRNLLQFVVRHSRVPSQALKEEIPPAVLRSISSPRSHLSSSVAQLISERDDAVTERGVLQREATTTAGVDARRVALAAAAAARMAQIVADVDDELNGLRQASSAAEDMVNGMLMRFGEPPASVDAFDWFRDLDAFITQYDDEYADFVEITSRKEKRALLAKKQLARESYLAHEERPHESSGSPANDRMKVSDDSRDFDRAVESAQRSAIVELPKRIQSAKIIKGQGVCSECKMNSKLSHPGAYSKADNNWYCADCWYDFSFKNESWKEDFGQETQPVEAVEEEEEGASTTVV